MGSRSSGVVAITARNALVSMPEISRRCEGGVESKWGDDQQLLGQGKGLRSRHKRLVMYG